MRTRILGSIAAMAVGAGTAWGQGGMPAPAAVGPSSFGSGVRQVEGWGPPSSVVLPGMPGVPPGGPPIDAPMDGGMAPQPPVPMWPPPGPYGAPMFQSTPPAGHAAGANGAGVAPHFWSSFEYLLYFPKSQNVQTSLLTSSAPNDDGIVGRASTLNLVGPDKYTYNVASGFRITVGAFGDEDRRYGVEAVGFAIERKSNIQEFQSQIGGTPTLARPFVDSTTLSSSTAIIGDLNYGSGSAVFETSTQVWGVEALGVLNLYRTCPDSTFQMTIDGLGGYRFIELDETLSMTSFTNVSRPPSTQARFNNLPDGSFLATGSFIVTPVIPVGGTTVTIPGAIAIKDSFTVRNNFNGGEVGLRSFSRYGMFSLLMSGKVAFGSMRQIVDISGSTGIADGIRAFSGGSYGGVLANASNIGRVHNYDYAVIPEFNVALGVNLTKIMTVSLGYNFLYLDNVVRPGDLINPVVNRAQIPANQNFGAANTVLTSQNLFPTSEYFLHGMSVAMTFRY